MAFGVIAIMLYVAGFPIFFLFFIGVLTFFIAKVFTAESRNEIRRIFEFYLSANEILRDDEKRWYGFEIQETIARGEHIVRSMSAAPPLVNFALGALYQKLDDHSSAVKYLAQVADESAPNETAIVYPTRELREYVRMLRKIERSPAEAPLTSSAIRSLERARKNRGAKLLEHSRLKVSKQVVPLPQNEQTLESVVDMTDFRERPAFNGFPKNNRDTIQPVPVSFSHPVKQKSPKPPRPDTVSADRKTISEVLHDIYDKNGQ